MKPYQANLINVLALILMPVWALIAFEAPADDPDKSNMTALIPVVFAIILFLFNGGLKKENKFISHLAVIFTLITIVAIYMKPFSSALADYNDNNSSENIMRIVRSGVMILTGVLSMIVFVRSFIANRKSKQS
ncbi:MAG: hypothetical protein CMD15_07065 [Flavobacteriales bacterium]|nr:hypothetical protein [Flavobacteriales bacterium]|tara:strand:+ start:203 stop:601 length:399 start_codon:yes stop_codon:yes gene_type:complete